jgi:hypothetical protein
MGEIGDFSFCPIIPIGENMKSRVKKRHLYSRLQCAVLLPRQFVKDTLRGVAEAQAGQATPYLGNRPAVVEAFGLWRSRKVDGMTYQEQVRSEW